MKNLLKSLMPAPNDPDFRRLAILILNTISKKILKKIKSLFLSTQEGQAVLKKL